jgi:hypothetical protein
MSKHPAPKPPSDADQLDAAAGQAIAACGGDVRCALKAMIVADEIPGDRVGEAAIGGFERLRARQVRAGAARSQGLVRRMTTCIDILFNPVETFEEIMLMRTVDCGFVAEHAMDFLKTLNRSVCEGVR